MDQKEIANFLAQELFYQQFITLEGLNSGVPTRTTPTLTPTTLRNIEQTFIELQSKPESHENEAGFVPPLVHAIGNNQYIPASEIDIYSKSSIWSNSQASTDLDSRPASPVTPKSGQQSEHTRRNMGGRKPVKDLNLTPEEEERRRIRRERNKMAAARCRKRRVDHTNSLLNETDGLEQKKLALQNELQELQAIKEELEFLLDSHRTSHCCRLQNGHQNDNPPSPPDIKPFVIAPYEKISTERVKTEIIDASCITDIDADIFHLPAKKVMLSSTATPLVKPSRPSSLNVCSSVKNNLSEIAGISITTPSTGIQFNFDSLMVGGTGLTPVSAPLVPSCSTQQRNIPTTHADISSPDTCGPPKLVSL